MPYSQLIYLKPNPTIGLIGQGLANGINQGIEAGKFAGAMNQVGNINWGQQPQQPVQPQQTAQPQQPAPQQATPLVQQTENPSFQNGPGSPVQQPAANLNYAQPEIPAQTQAQGVASLVKPNIATYQQQVYNQIPKAASILAQKYGMQAMNQVMPILKQQADMEVQKQYTTNLQQFTGQALDRMNNTKNPMEKAFWASQIGIDPKLITALSPDYEVKQENLGGSIKTIAVNKKDGKAIDISNDSVTLSPNTKYTADMGYQGRVDAATIRGNSKGSSNTKMPNGMTNAQEMNEVSKYKQWKANNPDKNLSDYPRADQYQAASDPYGNYQQAGDVVSQIKAANPTWTDDDVESYLRNKLGY